MRIRRSILALVAFLLAIAFVFLGAKLLAPAFKAAMAQKEQAEMTAPADPVQPQVTKIEPQQRVVVFSKAKAAGDSIIAAQDLTITLLPATQVPADAFTSMEISSDSTARDRIDGWKLRENVNVGDPAVMSNLVSAPKQSPEEIAAEQARANANKADKDFLDQLETDPAIVLFDEKQLSDLTLRAGATIDISVESPAPAISGNWVARQLIVSGATLRSASLDVTGQGAKPVFYAKLSAADAEKVRTAQSITNGNVKIEAHRDVKAIPPLGHICTGPNDCFELIQPAPEASDDPTARQQVQKAATPQKSQAAK